MWTTKLRQILDNYSIDYDFFDNTLTITNDQYIFYIFEESNNIEINVMDDSNVSRRHIIMSIGEFIDSDEMKIVNAIDSVTKQYFR